MLDRDLAELYGVETKALNQAVKRNAIRFPDDFMFQLTNQDLAALRSQTVTLEKDGRGRYSKFRPHAFTEQGVAMLSSVLNSERAALVNIEIMRAFTRMREMLTSHKELARKLEELERKVGTHDDAIVGIFKALHDLMSPRETRAIGFTVDIGSNPPASTRTSAE